MTLAVYDECFVYKSWSATQCDKTGGLANHEILSDFCCKTALGNTGNGQSVQGAVEIIDHVQALS